MSSVKIPYFQFGGKDDALYYEKRSIRQLCIEVIKRRPGPLLLHLKTACTNIAGLQPSGLGICVKVKSLPRFSREKSSSRFVQIVNIGDHWICLTNQFSDNVNEVFVYNSTASPTRVCDQVTVLATSLLRRYDDDSATITFSVRQFQQQSKQMRLCGYYAAATAVSCYHNTDPTGFAFDEFVFHLTDNKTAPFINFYFKLFTRTGRSMDAVKHE